MEFHKYSSIPHFDEEKELERVRWLIKSWEIEDSFVVQEKIHWANFSIWYDWENIKYAKRTAFLDKYDDFFEYEWMVKNREKEIKNLLEKIWKEQKAKKVVILYWELFGGSYPEAEKIKWLKNVQAGIWYTNILDFIGFDIFVDENFLDISKTNSYFKNSWLKYLQNLFEGNLEDCLLYSVEFESKIPELYGLEKIENNSTEGIIISHISRHIKFKKKNLKFKERSRKHRFTKAPKKMSAEAEKFWEKTTEFLSKEVLLNRLDNIVSKEWKLILWNKAKASGILARDVVEEISRRFDEYNSLEKQDRKLINSGINTACGLVLRDLG